MLGRIDRALLAALVAVAALDAGCATREEAKEEGTRITAAEMSAPARATVERLTAGGTVEKINRETEKGRVVYDVEATVKGEHIEYLIADSDGAVLGTESAIRFADLPQAVRAAAEKFFGTSSGLKAYKGEEYGETSYEIVGTKDGKTVEAVFDPSGKQLE